MTIHASDPRLTAYAFGELPAEEIPEIESALAANSELREEVELLRSFGDLSTEALNSDTPSFSAGEMATLRQRLGMAPAGGTRNQSFWRRSTRAVMWTGAAAACVAAMFVIIRHAKPGDTTEIVEQPVNSGGVIARPSLPACVSGIPKRVEAGSELISADPTSVPGDASEGRTFFISQSGLAGIQLPAPETLAALRTPRFSRIDGEFEQNLGLNVGCDSSTWLQASLLAQGRIPDPELIRLEELANAIQVRLPELRPGVEAACYDHPWRADTSLLALRLSRSESDFYSAASLLANGNGTLRLLGDLPVDPGEGDSGPDADAPEAAASKLFLFEGKFSEMTLVLQQMEADQMIATYVPTQPAEWNSCPHGLDLTMALVGLGEAIRDPQSGPSAETLERLARTAAERANEKLGRTPEAPAIGDALRVLELVRAYRDLSSS